MLRQHTVLIVTRRCGRTNDGPQGTLPVGPTSGMRCRSVGGASHINSPHDTRQEAAERPSAWASRRPADRDWSVSARRSLGRRGSGTEIALRAARPAILALEPSLLIPIYLTQRPPLMFLRLPKGFHPAVSQSVHSHERCYVDRDAVWPSPRAASALYHYRACLYQLFSNIQRNKL